MIKSYHFQTSKPGKNILILGAIHGNETAGPLAINRFIDELNTGKHTLLQGALTLVPICNPKAHEQDIRLVEENLNRVMIEHQNPTSYEQQLANEIYPLIKSHNIMLDLHSTHCQGDVPFAFCDYPSPDSLKLIDSLNVKYVLEGWPEIYAHQQNINDYSTEHAAHIEGNSGTTLECGYHKERTAQDIAYNAIINTLKTFEMLAGTPNITQKKHILLKSFTIKTREGKLLKPYKHLDKIIKNEPIARYTDGTILRATEDGYILLPNLNAEINTEWYYFGIDKY